MMWNKSQNNFPNTVNISIKKSCYEVEKVPTCTSSLSSPRKMTVHWLPSSEPKAWLIETVPVENGRIAIKAKAKGSTGPAVTMAAV